MPVMDFGGVESRIVTQSGLMDRERFDFRVCTFWKKGDAAKRVEALGVTVDELGTDPDPRNPRALARLTEYVWSHRTDVVHASILEANLQAAALRRLPGAPSVAIEEVGNPERSLKARLAFGALYRSADVVIGVGEKTCRLLRTNHWLPEKKVRLIYNAINPRFLDDTVPLPTRARPQLLAVGRLVDVKNHEVVLRALAQLSRDERPFLKLACEGPLRPQLEALIGELGLHDDVQLLGFRSDVRELLDDADGYVMSSFSEGTSISLAEAMARARPVLTSWADGIDEAMVGYEAGWQLDARDVSAWVMGLRRLTQLKREERERLGTLARGVVNGRMSVAKWRAQLEGLYLELAQAAAARRAKWPLRLLRALR